MSENVEQFDLVLDRVVPLSVSQLWDGWTNPTVLMQWFCPLPYLTLECDIDLRPGGGFRTVMQSPEGVRFDNSGCYLAVEENHRLVWTTALGPDYQPNPLAAPAEGGPPSFHFTCELTFTETPDGARYLARGMHASKADRDVHEQMGFAEGWGAALDQLVALYAKAS